MAISYSVIKDLKISQGLADQLCSINWQELPLAFRVDSAASRQFFFKNYRLIDYFDFAKHYGLTFNRVATLDTYILPQSMEQQATKEIQNYFHQEFDDLVIRLQVAYDGGTVPLHRDPTRTASLVYPLDHHAYSSTVFYTSVTNDNTVDGMLNPTLFAESSRVCIDRYPVLLDVKQAHQVYLSNTYTKQRPRLSLSVKWKTLEFNQVIK